MGCLVAIQIQVPLEVGLAFGYDLGNEFADQIRAGCGLAQIQNFFQCGLNLPPLRLIHLDDGIMGLGVVFRLQLLQFLIQLLSLIQEFLLGDFTVRSHFQKHFLLEFDALHLAYYIGQGDSLGSCCLQTLPDHIAGVVNQIPLILEYQFEDLLAHQLQLPVCNHGLIAVAGIVSTGFSALIGRTVVQNIVALIPVGVGLVIVLVPDILPEATSAGAAQAASPKVSVFLNTVDGFLSLLCREAFLHPSSLDFLGTVPFFRGHNRREITLDADVAGLVMIVDPLLLQIIVVVGFSVSHYTHIGLIVQNTGYHTVAPLVDSGCVQPSHLCKPVGNLAGTNTFVPIHLKNHANRFSLIGVDDIGAAYPFITQYIAGTVQSTFFPADFLTGTDTLGNLTAFLLCQGRHEGKPQLAIPIHSPDVILYEVYFHTDILQFSGMHQRIHCITGETTDLTGYDQVELTGTGIFQHPKECRTLLCLGSGDTFVNVLTHYGPVGMVAKLIVVPLHLVLQRRKLGFMLRGHTAIENDIAGPVAVQIAPGIS